MLQMFDNPVLAVREYQRFVRDLNISINVHNAVCKPHPVRPLSRDDFATTLPWPEPN